MEQNRSSHTKPLCCHTQHVGCCMLFQSVIAVSNYTVWSAWLTNAPPCSADAACGILGAVFHACSCFVNSPPVFSSGVLPWCSSSLLYSPHGAGDVRTDQLETPANFGATFAEQESNCAACLSTCLHAVCPWLRSSSLSPLLLQNVCKYVRCVKVDTGGWLCVCPKCLGCGPRGKCVSPV